MMDPIEVSGTGKDPAGSNHTAQSPEPAPSAAQQKLDTLRLAWRESRFLRDEPVVGVLEENLTTLIQVFGAERLAALLPNPKVRPLAAGAAVMELAQANLAPEDLSAIHLTRPSKTLAILNAPYQPTFMRDTLPRLQTAEFKREAQVALGDALCESLIPNTANGGLNSTLKNLLLAVRLNETIFKTTKIKASIQRAQYTWEGLNAKVSPQYDLPTLPGQTAKDSAVKLVVSLIEDGKAKEVYLFKRARKTLEHF